MLALFVASSFSITCAKCFRVAQVLKQAKVGASQEELARLCHKNLLDHKFHSLCTSFVNEFYPSFKIYLGNESVSPMRLCTASKVCKKQRIAYKKQGFAGAADQQQQNDGPMHIVVDNTPEFCGHIATNFLSLFKSQSFKDLPNLLRDMKSVCSKTNSVNECVDYIALNIKAWIKAAKMEATAKDLCMIGKNLAPNGAPSFQDETRPDWSISWEEALA